MAQLYIVCWAEGWLSSQQTLKPLPESSSSPPKCFHEVESYEFFSRWWLQIFTKLVVYLDPLGGEMMPFPKFDLCYDNSFPVQWRVFCNQNKQKNFLQ